MRSSIYNQFCVCLGEVVIAERPYVSSLFPEFHLSHCLHCFKRCQPQEVIKCPQCLEVMILLVIFYPSGQDRVIIFTHGVSTSFTITKTHYNANVGARITKYELQRTSCVNIMTTYWLWPGGSP